MSDEKQEAKKEDQKTEQEQPIKNISVKEVFGQYPIDRDKARDVLLMEISQSLININGALQAISQGLVVANTHLEKNNSMRQKRHAGL